jgi:tetratricopeptide (TPR) repeat protein
MGQKNYINSTKSYFIILQIIIIINIILFSKALANDREKELKLLFEELKTGSAELMHLTEKKIWDIWSTHPTDKKLTEILSEGSTYVNNNQLNKAIEVFSKVINLDPTWAEAWNKRATVLYMIGEYQKSQKDIDKVLELEERHFGALAGQGLVNIKLQNYEKALESYQKVEKIYPAMKSPKIMIRSIKKLIKEQSI